ncbi:MAG: Crp/Fnr family transcriptional regulator [Firmicutes bacterium]|nr:Crp/Fnr family transcriptional regulator [Bacillota bacterium]
MEVESINILNYIDALVSQNLFSSFSKEELLEILKKEHYELKIYEKGQIIHLQNEICKEIDIILEGQVSVQNIIENGNVLTIGVFSACDIIGANLIYSNSNFYTMTVISTAKTTVLHMSKELILTMCKKSEKFMLSFMQAISDRSIVLADKINTISLKTIRKSIIDFLKYEYYIQKDTVIKLNISKKDFAERLGIQRSSLSRELNKMRRDNLINFDARSITIKDLKIVIGIR